MRYQRKKNLALHGTGPKWDEEVRVFSAARGYWLDFKQVGTGMMIPGHLSNTADGM